MPDFFWRRRLRKQERLIVMSLPNLPNDIDDNVFIATGVSAAEQDKKSGAYDEFMFSEDGYASMPYEDSVDEFINLQIERTPERKGRAQLPHRLRLEHFNKRVEDRKRVVEDVRSEVEAVNALLSDENQVLKGEVKGEERADWSDVTPDTTSKSKHATQRLIGWSIFVIVAALDFMVILYSLRRVVNNQDEAIMFSIPTAGVQILFPHLVGRAIGAMRRKDADKTKEKLIAFGVGAAWLLYVIGMTILRVDLLKSLYFDRYHKEIPATVFVALIIISALILVGLGSWVLIRAINENPHVQKYSRLRYVYLAKNRKLRRAMKKLAKAEAAVATEEKALEEVSAQWENRAANYPVLAESAKSTYRRALVNQEGTPEFTTTYLPNEKTSLRKSNKDRLNV
ncbi:MAG: hypothetical protein NTX78_03680 [Rhodoluna sp.]|nr:hypothetical protein [Rhodoluna sp.]